MPLLCARSIDGGAGADAAAVLEDGGRETASQRQRIDVAAGRVGPAAVPVVGAGDRAHLVAAEQADWCAMA